MRGNGAAPSDSHGDYCVMNETANEFRLVSWHHEKPGYGNLKWPLK